MKLVSLPLPDLGYTACSERPQCRRPWHRPWSSSRPCRASIRACRHSIKSSRECTNRWWGRTAARLRRLQNLKPGLLQLTALARVSIHNRGSCKCCYTSCCSDFVTAGTGLLNVERKSCSSSCAEKTLQGLHNELCCTLHLACSGVIGSALPIMTLCITSTEISVDNAVTQIAILLAASKPAVSD